MAVPNPDFPGQGRFGPAQAMQPGTVGARPILVKGHDNLPEAYEEYEESDDLQEVLRNAPAWLASSVFHMLLLIFLGLLAVGTHLQSSNVAVEVVQQDTLSGTQMEDPSIMQGDAPHIEGEGPETMITPRDLPPVDNPLAAPIEVGDLKLGVSPVGVGTFTGPTTIAGAPIGLALKGRQIGSKNVLLGRYGGTHVTQKAVEDGLAWLAKQQRADGTWSLVGPYTGGAFNENEVAATAMALLAFQGNGDTHRQGKYSKVVKRGWTALLKLQKKDGAITSGSAPSNQWLYAHAQASIALCELYGMTLDSYYREPTERAIQYCVEVQDKKHGGWRYSPNDDSDTSVTGWFVMALQSARMAGLKVPQETLENVMRYLDSAELDGGRRYGYWAKDTSTPAVSAEGLLCRQYLGWRQDDPRLVEGAAALNEIPIAYDRHLNHDVYYWYYATQVTHHMEGKIWKDWNAVMSKEVPAHQTKAGPEAGSWDPEGDKWGSQAGRLYMTCLSIYILEVYYRHLPIYSGYRALSNTTLVPADEAAEKPSADKPAEGAKRDEAEKPAAKDE